MLGKLQFPLHSFPGLIRSFHGPETFEKGFTGGWGQSRREAGASAEAWRNPGSWTQLGPTLHLSDPVHFNSTFIKCSFINHLIKPRSREVKIFSQSSNALMAGLGF